LLVRDSSTPTPGGKGFESMKHKPKFGKLGAKLGKGKLGSSLSTVGSMRPGAIPLAIEFGVSGIKVLQLSGTKPSSIVSASFMPTPDDLLDHPAKRLLFQMDALPKFLKGEKINATRAMSLIPSGQMVCKHLQIIPAEGVGIEQIAGAQLSTQLGCDPNALIVRCRTVRGVQTNGKLEVVCFAASREFVGRIMGALKSAKLEPVGIHTEFDSLARAVELRDDSTSNMESPKPTLILDLGCGSTKVLIMHGHEMVFARSVGIGASHLDEVICHQLRCTMMEAHQIRSELEVLFPERVLRETSGAMASGIAGMPPMASQCDGEPSEHNESPSEHPSVSSGGFSRGPRVDLSEPLEIMCDEISM